MNKDLRNMTLQRYHRDIPNNILHAILKSRHHLQERLFMICNFRKIKQIFNQSHIIQIICSCHQQGSICVYSLYHCNRLMNSISQILSKVDCTNPTSAMKNSKWNSFFYGIEQWSITCDQFGCKGATIYRHVCDKCDAGFHLCFNCLHVAQHLCPLQF